MRQFCRDTLLPAAAAGRSPHAAAAPPSSSPTPCGREDTAAARPGEGARLIAAIEREWDLKVGTTATTPTTTTTWRGTDGEGRGSRTSPWAAKSVLEEPCGERSFGTLAVGAVDASCERLLALVESSPAHSTPALRVLGAMAGVASGAMTPKPRGSGRTDRRRAPSLLDRRTIRSKGTIPTYPWTRGGFGGRVRRAREAATGGRPRAHPTRRRGGRDGGGGGGGGAVAAYREPPSRSNPRGR